MRAISVFNQLMLTAVLAVVGVIPIGVQAQNPDVFTNDIRPIMERRCWTCHGEEVQRSGLDLRTRESALEGGVRGPAIVPGRADQSRLYLQVAGLEEPTMSRSTGSGPQTVSSPSIRPTTPFAWESTTSSTR